MNADDPRLTAYALGELSGEAAAEVAAAIEHDPALAAEVEAIRAMTGDLTEALQAEELPATEPVEMAEHIEFPMDKRAPKRFPYYWVSGLAAAGFAVLVMVQSPESPLVNRETTIVAPQRSATNPSPQGQAIPSLIESPPVGEISSEPERFADDMLREEADYSEKDRFEIAVESSPSPMPQASSAIQPAPALSPPPAEERMLTAAATVEATKERFDNPRPQIQPDPSEVTITGLISTPKTAPQTVKAEPVGSDVIELSPFTVSDSHDAGYAATSTISGSGPLRSNLKVSNEVTASSSNRMAANAGTLTLSGSNTYVGEAVDTQGSTRLASSLRDVGAISISASAPQLMVQRRMIQPEVHSGEDYAAIEEQGWQRVVDHPLSTFAVDVDSASYANVRRILQGGNLPPMDAIKVEELVNAFSYDYRGPEMGSDAPLMANLEVAAAPWAPQNRLVRIGLKAQDMPTAERGAANLVFLMDVSGSMNSPQKLPLVKEALRLLLGKLRDDDRVAIVTYAGSSGLALPSTPVSQRRAINAALQNLRPGGGTNGAMGIHLAYDIAKANFVSDGINRVILCTDGDFNVGTTGLGELGDLITAKAKSNVFLTALGFGMSNYQDDTLEQLANKGNGHHGYIDSVREARRLLVEQVEGTLNTVARDVKIQVEFNPAHVAAYRLIGYDNRRLAAEAFNDDTIDAGEIGAGHTVTALYEVIPADRPIPMESHVDTLRYQVMVPYGSTVAENAFEAEMLTVKLRAQPPEGGESRKWEFHLLDQGQSFDRASPDFKFAAAVAGFGLVLRDHPSVESVSLVQVEGWARSGITQDPGEYRSEFVELIGRADRLID